MLSKNLKNALSELGLDSENINVYEQLLTLKKPTITEISGNIGTYRRKVYEVLENLFEVGLVEENHLVPKSPVIIATLLKAKQYKLNSSLVGFQDELPNILSSFFRQGRSPDIRVFDGINKFLYLFNTILDEIENHQEILSFNEGDDLYEVWDLDYFLSYWIQIRVKKGVNIRILANSENTTSKKELPKDKILLRQTKFLKKNKAEKGCYWVFGSKIILWDTATPKAVLIDNTLLATMFRAQFEIIWEAIP